MKKAADLITRFIKPISYKTIYRHFKLGKSDFKFTKKTVRGGPSNQILVSSLPPEIQLKIITPSLSAESKAALQSSETNRLADLGDDAAIYSEAPEWQRKLWDKYSAFIIGPYKLFGPKILKTFLPEYIKQNPGLKISISSTYAARNKYKKHGLPGLLAKWGKNAGSTIVKDEWFIDFKSFYLLEGAPSVQSCRLRVLGNAKLDNPDFDEKTFPSPAAFMNRLNREIPASAQYLARYGFDKWNRKYGSYVDRDWSNIQANQCWVSDAHQLDVAVINPRTGLPCFPWITCWMDAKTGKMLSWFMHCESPASDPIFYSFYLACMAYGLPKEILIDNGKSYLCRDFAGGRKRTIKSGIDPQKDKKQISTLALLNIFVHFAMPYGAQSKNIERAFRVIIESLCKHMRGYRGSNVVSRPEKLADEIRHGDIMKFEEFSKLFDDFIINVFNKDRSNGKNLNGRSRDQAWAEEFTEKREVSPAALRLFCLRTTDTVTIGRNGVRDSQLRITYYGDFMAGCKGMKVYARRDIKNYAEALIFNAENDELLGTARAGVFNSPAFAKTEVEKSQFIAALAAKKREHRIIKEYAKIGNRSDSIDSILAAKAGIAAIAGKTSEADPKIHHIPNSEMDKVAAKKKRLDEEGTQDISDLAQAIPDSESKRKLAAWQFELEEQKTA